MLHKNVTTGDQHFLHNWTVSSSSNLAGIPVVASDQGKVALVTANSSFYILQDSTPTWQALGGGGAGGGAAISAGTQSVSTGTVNFSNSNNISFGMSGSNQVTASYNFNISAGTTSGNRNNVTFADSNGVSFGFNAGTITATVKTDYQSSGNYLTTAALSQDSSKYAGINSAITGGSMTVNTSGISINIPSGGGVTLSTYEPHPLVNSGASAPGQSSVYFTPFILEQNVAISRLNFLVSYDYQSRGSTGYAASNTFNFGIYQRDTANTNQMLLITSDSASGYVSFSSNVSVTFLHAIRGSTTAISTTFSNFYSSNGGPQVLYCPLTTTLSPGEYFMGAVVFTSNTNGMQYTYNIYMNVSQQTQAFNYFGSTGNTGNTNNSSCGAFGMGLGVYSANTAALPGTVSFNQIQSRSNMRQYFNMCNFLF